MHPFDPPVRLSVVIPTITGREDWLRKCLEAYRATSPADTEFLVVKDQPSCGHAWQVGDAKARGDFVHFTADDITPHANWWQEPMRVCEQGGVPAANVLAPTGERLLCDSPLGDMGHVRNVLVPFLSREQLNVGGWLLPIHYGSDDWVSYRAVHLGLSVVPCSTYVLTHYVASEGRNYLRRHADVATLVEHMREAGYVPPVYEQLERNLQTSATGLDGVTLKQLDRWQRDRLRRATS